MQVLFVSQIEKPKHWLPLLGPALPRDRVRVYPDVGDPADIEVALVAQPDRGVLGGLPNLRLVQSLWMGVDGLLADPTFPRRVPLARLVDPGMVAAMSESVLAHVLDLHRELYRYRETQARREWKRRRQRRAEERFVGVLGLGTLGTDAAGKLRALGFRVAGWSRRPKALDGVECFSGRDGLHRMVSRADILVCLLPLTEQTRGVIDRSLLERLPPGASVVNLARGAHVVDEDLLAALESGRVSRAVLDAFEVEPLPVDHAFWAHPNVTLTPHVAALTDPVTATPEVVNNLDRVRAGLEPHHLVDLASGY